MKLNSKDIELYSGEDEEEIVNKRLVKQIARAAIKSREEANSLNAKRYDNNEYGTKSNVKKRNRY